MEYDRTQYFTINDETGKVRQWTDAAIERHIKDEVGDLDPVVKAIAVLVENGAGLAETIESYVESAFAKASQEAYRAAYAYLKEALNATGKAVA